MKSKREEALVGVFVCIAAALLIGTVLAVAGTFSSGGTPYHTYFKAAGGLLPGATVRYAGMNAGKVKTVRIDPGDSTRIEIDFTVQHDIPVKIDSIAKIAALGALSDNFLEIGTGTKGAPLAPPGSELKSAETLGIADLGDMIGNLEPVAKDVLQNLDQRLVELQVTITRVNDLLNDKNRGEVSASLGNLNGLLADSRPKVAASLTNVQNATAQIQPMLDNLKTTMNQANVVLSHVDSMLVENQPGHSRQRCPIEGDTGFGYSAHRATQEHNRRRQYRPDSGEYPRRHRECETADGFAENQPVGPHSWKQPEGSQTWRTDEVVTRPG